MAADSSMGFHQGLTSSYYNHHVLSFQNGGVYSVGSSGVTSRGMNSTTASGGGAGVFLTPDNAGVLTSMPAISTSTSSPGGLAQNYKFVTGSPADWTTAELAVLREGLMRYAHEPNLMKYIKIAAMLPTRTIRDVALKCSRTAGKESTKRRKLDAHDRYSAKKMREAKDKMVVTSPDVNFDMIQTNSLTPFSLSSSHPNIDHLPSNEVEVIDNTTKNMLEENYQLLNRIAENVETQKLQENIDLFFQTGNNIKTALSRMSEMQGIMCRMPPLPVAVNDGCLSSLLQFNNLLASYCMLSSGHLKQEHGS